MSVSCEKVMIYGIIITVSDSYYNIIYLFITRILYLQQIKPIQTLESISVLWDMVFKY